MQLHECVYMCFSIFSTIVASLKAISVKKKKMLPLLIIEQTSGIKTLKGETVDLTVEAIILSKPPVRHLVGDSAIAFLIPAFQQMNCNDMIRNNINATLIKIKHIFLIIPAFMVRVVPAVHFPNLPRRLVPLNNHILLFQFAKQLRHECSATNTLNINK